MADTTGRFGRALVCVAIALASATVCLAQDQTPTTGVSIAKVSLARIERDYVALRAQEDTLGRWLESQRGFHDELASYVFLSSTDFAGATALLDKARPLSAEDTARLQALRQVSDQKDERFALLRAKLDRTPAENDEFNSLQDIYQARVDELTKLREGIMTELGDRRQTALAGLMTRVQESIDAEAASGGYALVLDADAVFYGGTDITDGVLARLNAGGEPAPGGEGAGQSGAQ